MDASIRAECDEIGRLRLFELTVAGRRHIAQSLGLQSPPATRYHGLVGEGGAQAGRRRRLLGTLAHTVGANAVFVAFASAAAKARAAGGSDDFVEWRSAAACERRRCKPDGYGCYVRNGVAYGFFVEYDRGTESHIKYSAKLHAYYQYRDSGQARRHYQGFPTLLFVTTRPAAEQRIANAVYRVWFAHGGEPLAAFMTTIQLINDNARGIVGPIWRSLLAETHNNQERHCWPPAEPERR
jgi:hypothetical protein